MRRMYQYLGRISGVALLVVGLLLLGAHVFAQGGEPANRDTALLRDARTYAQMVGIPLDEALQRLSWQERIGQLRYELEKNEEKFAGLWVEHEPDYKIVVAFARLNEEEAKKVIAKYVQDEKMRSLIRPYMVQRSLRELQDIQKTTLHIVNNVGIEAVVLIREQENRVEILTKNPNAIITKIEEAGLQLPDGVAVIQLDMQFRKEISFYGGRRVRVSGGSGGSGHCTSGFSVMDRWGNKGITTAGHCTPPVFWSEYPYPHPSDIYLPTVAIVDYGPRDIQWMSTDHAGVSVNRIEDGFGGRYILTVKYRPYMYIGEVVCKYGITTGYTCGIITSKWVALAYPNNTPTYIETTNFSSPGDSGAPYFYGNTAYGTHVGSYEINGNHRAVFMASDYIQNWGITIITWP